MSELSPLLNAAVDRGDLLASSRDNIGSLLQTGGNPLYEASVRELAEAGNWKELNDRFYKRLEFGTGGMRAQTIGRVVPPAERGSRGAEECPEHPATGTLCLNYYNLSRATQGLVRYLKTWHHSQSREGRPSLAIAHDTRYFSRDFAEACAQVASENGCDVYLFKAARSTPQLSFAVRQLNATGGVVLTASHNPFVYNGFKVYFEDGAQVVDQQADDIVKEVDATPSESYQPLPLRDQGRIQLVGEEFDEVYMDRLESLLLQPEMVSRQSGLKIVFTNLHGTGGVISPQMLRRLNFQCTTVQEQDEQHGRFPSVESPNPEEAGALKKAIQQAEAEGADLVIGTDPDCDRMGAAVRNAEGELKVISGNQIGSLMGYYRIKTFFEAGILNASNRQHAVWVKTLVTSPLQDAIARKFGINCVNTLTGFKYIGKKLRKYEQAIPAEERGDYRRLSPAESRALRLQYSQFFVFGGEESYGYLGDDFVRDKDGNGAVVMFAEVAAYAKSRGISLMELLDEIYREFGYFLEVGKSLVETGAEGAAKIERLANSYRDAPPTEVDGVPVVRTRNFFNGGQIDEEGDEIPAEKMLMVELADGRSFAVRPSGTEPKIKYYLFGSEKNPGDALQAAKERVSAALDSMWKWIGEDIERRLK